MCKPSLESGPALPNLMVDRQVVDSVDQFVSLRSTLNSQNGSCSKQQRRTGFAASNVGWLSCVWSLSHLSLGTKLSLYVSLITPMLLCASETLTLTKVNLDRFAFHMRCQRQILVF